ncbi:urea transport system substrate-binding protein [Rhodobacter sp. 140A]|jgi:urea transport system substrate-binding protein|uniref:urea ABC transporter substrate-binding protein n=1 Tax=Thioclava TaxID=285107 RepID=UPI000C35C561|nr:MULTISPECIES: urea ABC transporter substrate-binding protein [Thioclava]MAQ38453.1 branched-chain amino acid ABC transporter substrate-binding protein [Thioclava sp.]RBP84953.1 urea transport system substrate-binding protein [Rhodobacter sp. 140A]
MKRRQFLSAAGSTALAAAASSFPLPGLIRRAYAASGDTVKLGCLFSSSGTMANIEGRLNYVVKMAADEINAKGGVLGKMIEPVITDPGSDWPLYAQLGKQLIQQEKVAVTFGCWTSVSRKSVLPVVEQNDALLYYPLHFEGEENSKNVVYLNSPPSSSVLPAVEYLMSEEGGSAKRFFMLGSDYVWPRTINQQLKGYWKSKGIEESAWREEYVPLGFSNFQTLVNQIRDFADQPGGQPIVVLTVVGNSIPDFFREFINQGISAFDVPVLALDAVEADLEGLDTKPLVGHLNCWAYLQNAKGEKNKEFLANWANYVTTNKVPFKPDVAIDPMVSTYDGVHLWAMAAEKAGSFDVPEVRSAFGGLSFDCPSGYNITMGSENNYVKRGVFIGSVNEAQGFDVLWQSPDTPEPLPFSPYMKG